MNVDKTQHLSRYFMDSASPVETALNQILKTDIKSRITIFYLYNAVTTCESK